MQRQKAPQCGAFCVVGQVFVPLAAVGAGRPWSGMINAQPLLVPPFILCHGTQCHEIC